MRAKASLHPPRRLRLPLCLLALLFTVAHCGNQPLILLDVELVGGEDRLEVTLVAGDKPGMESQRIQLASVAQPGQRIQVAIYPSKALAAQPPIYVLLAGYRLGCSLSHLIPSAEGFITPSGLQNAARLSAKLSLYDENTNCSLAVEAKGPGSVGDLTGIINCREGDQQSVCAMNINSGAIALLEAKPDPGYFAMWSSSGPACHGPLPACIVTHTPGEIIRVEFRKLTCGPTGWCETGIPNGSSNLTGVAVLPSGRALISTANGKVLRCVGATCVQQPAPPATSLTAVAIAGDPSKTALGYVVGAAGMILRCSDTGDACAALNTGTMEKLNAVWASDINNIYAVGASGTVVRCTATDCSSLGVGTGDYRELTAVWGSNADNVYVAGTSGKVVHCAAGNPTCTSQSPSITDNLNGVWVNGVDIAWVVGNAGRVLRCTPGGGNCSMVTAGMFPDLRAVVGIDISNIYAVGAGGTVLRCTPSPTLCSKLSVGTTADLVAVAKTGASEVTAVGRGGTIVTCKTSGACTLVQNGGSDLLAIAEGAGGHRYIVGAGGRVLYHAP